MGREVVKVRIVTQTAVSSYGELLSVQIPGQRSEGREHAIAKTSAASAALLCNKEP